MTMFNPTGLFKDIPCPKRHTCDLLNCIFSHDLAEQDNSVAHGPPLYDPLVSVQRGETVSTSTAQNKSDQQPAALQREDQPQQLDDPVHSRCGVAVGSLQRSGNLSQSSHQQSLEKSLPRSSKRPVSPPPTKKVKKARHEGASEISRLPSSESLTPRMVPSPPERFELRTKCLRLLFDSLTHLNQLVVKDSQTETWSLSSGQLNKMAVTEEERIAVQHRPIYKSIITNRVKQLRNMDVKHWIDFLQQKLLEIGADPTASEKGLKTNESTGTSPKEDVARKHPHNPETPTDIITGLDSVDDEITILRTLRTPIEGLERYGYVTNMPTSKETEESKKGLDMAAGFEVCERCSSRFQVFPGRDRTGRLTSGGSCEYHWAKLVKPAGSRLDNITGQAAVTYSCCGKGVGSEGCVTAETHVFKVADVKRLASILQFKHTPELNSSSTQAVTFDCEMAYTTLGMELIRLTAVSWPTHTELIDVLVRPQGEILDLNTRFSGISKELFSSALPFGAGPPDRADNTSEDGELEPEPMYMVESPEAARELLFKFLTPETALIGHAIDNDLNVCRIIHPFIVDTVLLYPHPKGLPIRYSLKMLANRHLGRAIQSGGELGHDSKEDAIATGDLVREKVRQKWNNLRLRGWSFKEGKLLPPDEDSATMPHLEKT